VPAWLPNWVPLVLIVAAVLLFLRLRAQKRRVALTEMAQRLGLTFEATDWGSRSSGPQLESPHFANSYNQSFANSLSGERAGLYASFFDHVINSRNGHTDTIASFTQGIFLPEFALVQQDVLKKIGELVRHRQIDFPSDTAFSERFDLVGSDEDRVRELFTADMREFLAGIEPEWRIEASGPTLLMYQAGYTVKPEEFSDFVDETTEIAKNFFSHCHLKKPAF
jgi:hypothetical protein